jgi:hypothetical protein
MPLYTDVPIFMTLPGFFHHPKIDHPARHFRAAFPCQHVKWKGLSRLGNRVG